MPDREFLSVTERATGFSRRFARGVLSRLGALRFGKRRDRRPPTTDRDRHSWALVPRAHREVIEANAEAWRRRGAQIGRNVRIIGTLDGVNPHLISIGDNSVVGAQAGVLAHGPTKSRPTKIGDNVYIGFGAIVLPGVTIGDNCIVGAGAVVTRDVPPNSICAGNPARVLRERNPEELNRFIQAMEEGCAIGAVPPLDQWESGDGCEATVDL